MYLCMHVRGKTYRSGGIRTDRHACLCVVSSVLDESERIAQRTEHWGSDNGLSRCHCWRQIPVKRQV